MFKVESNALHDRTQHSGMLTLEIQTPDMLTPFRATLRMKTEVRLPNSTAPPNGLVLVFYWKFTIGWPLERLRFFTKLMKKGISYQNCFDFSLI